MTSPSNILKSGRLSKLALGLISFSALFIHAFPLMLGWKILREDSSGFTIISALQSYEFKIALISSLSMAVPMILELIARIIFNSKIELAGRMIFSNFLILLILIIPDLVILLYCIPFVDIFLLGFVIKARIICVSWTSLTLIHQHCESYWSPNLSCIFHFLICVADIPDDFMSYFNISTTENVEVAVITIQCIAVVVSLFIILKLSYNWYQYIKSETTMKELSTDQYLCTVYISAFIICGLGLYGNYFSHMSEVQWYNFDKTNLVVHTLMFTVFYIIIVVFENRGLQIAIARAQVSISSKLYICICIYINNSFYILNIVLLHFIVFNEFHFRVYNIKFVPCIFYFFLSFIYHSMYLYFITDKISLVIIKLSLVLPFIMMMILSGGIRNKTYVYPLHLP